MNDFEKIKELNIKSGIENNLNKWYHWLINTDFIDYTKKKFIFIILIIEIKISISRL